MLYLFLARIESNEVVVFIIPHQSPRTNLIFFSVIPQLHLLLYIPLVVKEAYLFVCIDGFMEKIDVIVNLLIYRFDATGNKHLPL